MDLDDEDSLFVPDDDDVIELDSSPPRTANSNNNNNSGSGSASSNMTSAFTASTRPGVIPPQHLPGIGVIDLEQNTTPPNDPQQLNRRRLHHHHHHHHHHPRRRHHHHHHHHHHHPRARQATSDVIDLTGETTRTEAEGSQTTTMEIPTSNIGRNPRRTFSQRVTPPSLSRSDGTLSRSAQPPDVIDLTGDSPEQSRPPHHLRPRQPQTQRRGFHSPTDSLWGVTFGASGDHSGYRLSSLFNTGMGMSLLNLGLARSVHSAPRPEPEPSRKPSMEPLPPAREGFTRNTCADPSEEMVVVCPCCDEELAYDTTANTTSKDKKRKRAPGEHHYWALKKCGHVG